MADSGEGGGTAAQTGATVGAKKRQSFLRIPPFPGARPNALTRTASSPARELSDEQIDGLILAVARHRIGGSYWGAQPALPPAGYVLVRGEDRAECDGLARSLRSDAAIFRWPGTDGHCDPWHLVRGASAVVVDADDDVALIAAIAGVPVTCVGTGDFAALGDARPSTLRDLFRDHVVRACGYIDPYTGEPISAEEAIEHCGFWRRLIDSNRDIVSAVGFGFWKRPTVAPLLWAGSHDVPFANGSAGNSGPVAVWKARTAPAVLSELEKGKVPLIEVEDGFIRSAGLGADCVPPLSIVVDRLGAYFDPTQPSELEQLIQEGGFAADLLDRARRLRELIVASGVSKYDAGAAHIERPAGARHHILLPGQVEDDRAVLCAGGEVTSNLELLRRAREHAPGAYILYKPHPDVEAGHRVGAIPDRLCLTLADEVVRDQPISALIDAVDELHVNSSLAGFEALLRGKRVTTHGVPFYAGWGLTRDLGPVPARRTAARTLDELVAAVLLLYPRYLDPLTGLPCPPEILIRRLSTQAAQRQDGIVVRLRRLQGHYKRRFAELRPW